jgi:hypothetical protein
LRCAASHTEHTSAYVSIRQHTSAYGPAVRVLRCAASHTEHTSAYVSIRQHTDLQCGCCAALPRAQQAGSPAPVHTPAYVSIRPSAYAPRRARNTRPLTSYVSIRQHTSVYVSIRQQYPPADASNCLRNDFSFSSYTCSIRQHTSAYAPPRARHTRPRISSQHTSAYVSIHQHTSAYVSIRTAARAPHSPADK